MVKRAHVEAFGHGLIRNDQVQPVQRELCQQIRKFALAGHHANGDGQGQCGFEQPVHHGFVHGIGHTHAKFLHCLSAMGLAHRSFQLAAQGKNLIGIAQRQTAGFGQLHGAATFLEEFVPQFFFEQSDLSRQCLRRGVQLRARAHDAPRFGCDPEVMQVFEVHGG